MQSFLEVQSLSLSLFSLPTCWSLLTNSTQREAEADLHFLDTVLIDFLQELNTADENGCHEVAQRLKDISGRQKRKRQMPIHLTTLLTLKNSLTKYSDQE